MKIGVDLDDVIFEFTKEVLIVVEKVHGRKFGFEDVSSYSFHDVFDLSLEEIVEIIKGIDMANLPLIEGARDSVLKLSNTNEIYFITSRVFQEGTRESLERHFSGLKYDLFFSSNPHAGTTGKNKGEICREIGVDFMIEDSQKHAKICADYGIKTFLIEKPWNLKSFDHENILKVKNWEEILERIENEH
jgi:5'(3')-deoxyribonucleotidase